jgi:hypothetical protein
MSVLITYGLAYAGFAFVSFALRFPTGNVPARWRWLDRTLWIALAAANWVAQHFVSWT